MLDKALSPIDWLLNRVTMYRLITLYLGGLVLVALLYSFIGRLTYSPQSILLTTVLAVGASVTINRLFANTFGAPVNDDSALITGLILALIVGPAETFDDIVFVAWVATLAMSSKYILAWRNLHLFNPAAIAVVLTGLVADQTASWWIGTRELTPFVIAGGLLVVRRIRRGDLVFGFLWSTIFVTLAWDAIDGMSFTDSWQRGLLGSQIWFLAFAMLTEPITLPPRRAQQLAYGVALGVLVVPRFHIGDFYLTPELALVVANLAALPFRSMTRRRLSLERALAIGPGLIDFIYRPAPAFAFQPGQYMEWTLDHAGADSRGTRRYFTLASSPTEPDLRIGVRFSEHGSSYKRSMLEQAYQGGDIVATQIAGDFTMPHDPGQKLAFIAGGIGVTPFRSMVKYLLDRRERRDIVLLYANSRVDQILYNDVFWPAQRVIPFRPAYVLSDPASAGPQWYGESGHIDAAMIARQIPDFRDRLFYVSGSPEFVRAVVGALRQVGVRRNRIKTDDFSGL